LQQKLDVIRFIELEVRTFSTFNDS
jgi:hypothetical protein